MENVVQLSKYSLDPLRDNGEFILYRAHVEQLELPFRSAASPGVNPAQPRDTQEDRSRILIEGSGLTRSLGAAPGPFSARRADIART